MKYKLIAIDMDGTLLNSENYISERTKRALRAATEKGIHVVLSTGRILKSATYYSQQLGLKNPIVASNGGIMVDADSNILFKSPLDKKSIKEIVKMADDEDVYCHLYDESRFYSSRKVQQVIEFYGETDGELNINLEIFKHIDDILCLKDLNIYKLIFIDENPDKLRRFREKISKVENINISSSWWNNIEAMALDVSKGGALKRLIEMLNIEFKDVIAIGDSENDLSMLNIAGLSIAMANGSDEIKKKVDYITDSNDNDGVAKAIEKFVLESDENKYEL